MSYQAQIDYLKDIVNNTQTAYNQTKSENDANKAKIITLESEIAILKTKIAEVRCENEENKRKLADLELAKTLLTPRVTITERKATEDSAKITTLQSSDSQLRVENAQLKDALQEEKRRNDELRITLEKLSQLFYETVTSDNQKILLLQQSYSEMQAQLAELTKTNMTLLSTCQTPSFSGFRTPIADPSNSD